MLTCTRSFLVQVLVGILTSALGKPQPAGSETLDVHQAEEHSNFTLTWIHPHQNAAPPKSLYIDLINMESQRTIYWYDSRVEAESFTDDLFRGRLQCDPQLVENGQINFLLTDLRLDDTGKYLCFVNFDGRRDFKQWELVVKAAVPQTQEETQEPIDRGRFGLHVGLGLFLVVTGVLVLHSIISSGFRLSTFFSKFMRQ